MRHGEERKEGAVEPASFARNKVAGDVAWTSLGSALYLGSQWLILVLVARVLGEEALGEFALALAITAPVLLFTRMQLRTVHATDAARRWAFRDYLQVALAGGGAGLLISAVVMSVAGVGRSVLLVGLLIAAGRIAETASETVYGELQRLHALRAVAGAYVLKGAAGVACVGVSLLLGLGVVGVGLGLLVGWGLTFFAVDLRRYRRLRAVAPQGRAEAPDRGGRSLAQAAGRLRPMLLAALPLGGIAMLSSLLMNVPKYVLAAETGEAAVGVFTALAYFIVVGGRVNVAMGQAVLPVIASHLASNRGARAARWSGLYVSVSVFVGVCAIGGAAMFGAPLLEFVFGPAYRGYAPVFVLLMVAGLGEYLSVAFRNLLIAVRRITMQVPITIGSLLICLVLSVMMVPADGLRGAAIAFSAALAFEVVGYGGLFVVAWRRLRRARGGVATLPAA